MIEDVNENTTPNTSTSDELSEDHVRKVKKNLGKQTKKGRHMPKKKNVKGI